MAVPGWRRAFTESEVERDQRLELESLERHTVARLDGSMSGDQVSPKRRAQLGGDQRGRAWMAYSTPLRTALTWSIPAAPPPSLGSAG